MSKKKVTKDVSEIKSIFLEFIDRMVEILELTRKELEEKDI